MTLFFHLWTERARKTYADLEWRRIVAIREYTQAVCYVFKWFNNCIKLYTHWTLCVERMNITDRRKIAQICASLSLHSHYIFCLTFVQQIIRLVVVTHFVFIQFCIALYFRHTIEEQMQKNTLSLWSDWKDFPFILCASRFGRCQLFCSVCVCLYSHYTSIHKTHTCIQSKHKNMHNSWTSD